MKCISYTRVSSDKQSDKDGPERQSEAIRLFAAQRGFEVASEFHESAGHAFSDDELYDGPVSDLRPVLIQALDWAKANGVDALVVEHPDRWSRSVFLALRLGREARKRGITVWSASGGEPLNRSENKLMSMMRILFAEEDKDKAIARLKEGRDRASSRLGKRVEGRKKMRRGAGHSLLIEYAVSGMGWPEIARTLNKARFRTLSGRPFTRQNAEREFARNCSPEQKQERRLNLSARAAESRTEPEPQQLSQHTEEVCDFAQSQSVHLQPMSQFEQK